jgi:hypothetical protein
MRQKKNNNKPPGIALILIGVVLSILSLAADAIGIGGEVGFGFKQNIGLMAGFLVSAMGFILYRSR